MALTLEIRAVWLEDSEIPELHLISFLWKLDGERALPLLFDNGEDEEFHVFATHGKSTSHTAEIVLTYRLR